MSDANLGSLRGAQGWAAGDGGDPGSGSARWATLDRYWLVYLCLAVVPWLVISLPVSDAGKRGIGEPHAGLVDLLGLPILLLLVLRVPRSTVFLALCVFLGSVLISALNVEDSGIKTSFLIYRLAAIYAPFVLALCLVWNLESAERALRIFWWGGLIGCLYGFSVFWIVGPVREYQQALHLGAAGPVYRAGGALGNSGGFSHLITGWAMAAICLRWIGFGRLPLPQMLVTVAILAYGIITTASRSSVLQTGVALGCSILFTLRAGRSNVNRVVPVIGGLSVAALLLVPIAASLVEDAFLQGVIERFGLTDQRSIVDSGRWTHWLFHLDNSGWRLFGTGYKTTSLLTMLAVDNSYLRIYLEEGIIGLMAFLAFWPQVLLKLLQGHPDAEVRRLRGCAAAMLAGELARMFFSDTFTMFLSTPTMAILMAIMLRLRREESETSGPEDGMQGQ